MRRLLGGLFRNCQGFSLAEMLVALAIIGIILGGSAATIVQLTKVSQSDSNRITAIRNLDTAGTWFTRDLEPAQSPLPASVTLIPGGNPLAINQSVLAPSDTTVSYIINGTKQLQRTVGSYTTIVAENIESVAYWSGSPNTVQITAIVDNTRVTRTYKAVSRITQ